MIEKVVANFREDIFYDAVPKGSASFFMEKKMKTCCFIGHRKVEETPELLERLKTTIEKLICEENADTFIFGSKSQFDDLCLKITTILKEEHPDIKLIYYRSHFQHISKEYENYLLNLYDQTLMPTGIENSGKASYIERNQKMIDNSDFCVFYYDKNYIPPIKKQTKSGTMLAYEYAIKMKKQIINLFKNKKG